MAAHPPGPSLTVAIPTCNGAGHLAEAIRSIVSQDGVEFDLIVSDDRSDEETLTVVRKAAGDRARIEVNSSDSAWRGIGTDFAAIARTAIVTIFHQDDVMLPGHLSAHAASFANDVSVGLTASASVVIDERGCAVSQGVVEQGDAWPIRRLYLPGQFARSMAAGNPLRCSAITLCRHGCSPGKRGASTRNCVTWSTGIAGCDYRGNGQSRGWPGRPFRSAGIPPARRIASNRAGRSRRDGPDAGNTLRA